MLLVSNDAAQTLAAGESATFSVLRQTGSCNRNQRSEILSQNNSSILLRSGGLYEVGFHANVTGTTTDPVELSLQFAGGTLAETTSVYTPAAANAVGQIGAQTYVGTMFPASSFTLTLTNTGANPITISPNAFMYARRVG